MDNNEIIINAKNFINKYGDINTSLLKEHGKEFGISKSIISYNFKTLKNLREILKIDSNNRIFQKLENINVSLLEQDILRFIESHNLTQLNVNKYGKLFNISMSKIIHIYGSINNLKESLGLKIHKNKYPKEDIISKLFLIYSKYGYISKELLENTDKDIYVNSKTIYRIWGSFENMYQELFPELIDQNMFSNGELMVSKILEEFNIEFETQKTFNFSGKFKYDFYIASHNIIIEYHGIQHYEFVKLFHKTEDVFLKKQNIDKIKKEFIESNNIRYLEISYTESIDSIRIILQKLLQPTFL